jgi:CBS domain containing-hemolysin-like protein
VTLAATFSPIHLAVCAGAVALAGLGSLAAASLIGYSPSLLAEHLEDERHPQRENVTADFQAHDNEYLVVAILYAAIGWMIGQWALQNAVDEANQGWAFGAFGGAMLLFAGSLPVAITQIRAERVLMAVRPVLRAGWLLLRWPLVLPLLAVTRLCLQLLRIRTPKANDAAEMQKQVMAAVADSVTESDLASEERTWIGNIVALADMQVAAVMRPRPDIIAFAANTPLREAVQQAMEHGFSRYPVYEERIDEVIGIFYVKDALRILQDTTAGHGSEPVRTMLRDPLFVPETMGVAQLLRRFQAGHLHMAIVLDEYGTTAGLVSVEDVLEQIVGDIGDEYDSPPDGDVDPDGIQVIEEGRVLEIPGRTDVGEVNERLGTDLPVDGDWETIAGLVISMCNRIPGKDETVTIGDTEFHVLEADERRLLRLRVTALGAQPAEEAG